MTRLAPVDQASFTPDEQALYAKIQQVPHNPTGPTAIWSRSPKLCMAALDFGDYIRFDAHLSQRLVELAVCVTAVHYRSENEWIAHAPKAEAEGIPRAYLDAIWAGEQPTLADPLDELVATVTRQLHTEGDIRDETWAEAQEVLGDRDMVELISTVGFYSMIAMLLNGTRAKVNPR